MVKNGNAQRQTSDKAKPMIQFGNNLALSGVPEHMRYDLYYPDTRHAMAQELAVREEEARYMTDPGPQHLRPAGDPKKVPSRLPKVRQSKLAFKASPLRHVTPTATLIRERQAKQAKKSAEQVAKQASKAAEYLDVGKFLKNERQADELEEQKDFFDLPNVDFPPQLNNPFLQNVGKTDKDVLSYSMQSGPDHQAASDSEVKKKSLACIKCHRPSSNARDFQRHREKCMPDFIPTKGRPPIPNEEKARPVKGYEERGRPVQFSLHSFKVSVIRQKLAGETRAFREYDTDRPRHFWKQDTAVGAELFDLARKQKKEAKKAGFHDEDVDTDQECVRHNKEWMNEDLEETIGEFIRDPTQDAFKCMAWGEKFKHTTAIFQPVSQDADNEQDDRSVTPTFAPTLRDVICDSEERFASVWTSQRAQPFTSHEGSVPPSVCAFSACYKQSQDDAANVGHSHGELVQNLHFTELGDAWEKGELQGPSGFGQY